MRKVVQVESKRANGAWRAFKACVISRYSEHTSVSIRIGAAYQMLRSQECFRAAPSKEIRAAIWSHSVKVNLSPKRPDEGKYNHWPPRSRAQEMKSHEWMNKMLGSEPLEIPPGSDELWEIWTPTGGHGWVRLPIECNGLPNKEAYIAACWRLFAEEWTADGRPPPPCEWPRFFVRFLSPDRLAKAASSLAFECQMCGSNQREFFGSYLIEAGKINKDYMNCGGCYRLLDDLKHQKNQSEKARIRRELAQRATSLNARQIKHGQTALSSILDDVIYGLGAGEGRAEIARRLNITVRDVTAIARSLRDRDIRPEELVRQAHAKWRVAYDAVRELGIQL